MLSLGPSPFIPLLMTLFFSIASQAERSPEELKAIRDFVGASRRPIAEKPCTSARGAGKIERLTGNLSDLVHDSDEIVALKYANRVQLEEVVCEARWIADLDAGEDSKFREDSQTRVEALSKQYGDISTFTKHLKGSGRKGSPRERQKALMESVAPKLSELYPVYRKLTAVNNKLISPLPVSCHGGNAQAPFPDLEVMRPEELRTIQKELLSEYEGMLDDLPYSGHPFAKKFYLDSMAAMEPTQKFFCQRRENTFDQQKFLAAALNESGDSSFQKSVVERMKHSNAADLNSYQNFGKRGDGYFSDDYQKFLVQMGAFETKASEKVSAGSAKLNQKYAEERRQQMKELLGDYAKFAESMDVLCLAPPPAPPPIVLAMALVCEGYEIVDALKMSYENNCAPDMPQGYRENICAAISDERLSEENLPHFQGSAIDSRSCVLQTSGQVAMAATPYLGKLSKAAKKTGKLAKKAGSKAARKRMVAKQPKERAVSSQPASASASMGNRTRDAVVPGKWYREVAEKEAGQAYSRAVQRGKKLDQYYAEMYGRATVGSQYKEASALLLTMNRLVDQSRKEKLAHLFSGLERKGAVDELEAHLEILLREGEEAASKFREVLSAMSPDRKKQISRIGEDLGAEKLQLENMLDLVRKAKSDSGKMSDLRELGKRSLRDILAATTGNMGELDLYMRLPHTTIVNSLFSSDSRYHKLKSIRDALKAGDLETVSKENPLIQFVDRNVPDSILISPQPDRKSVVLKKLEIVMNKDRDVLFKGRDGREVWGEVKNRSKLSIDDIENQLSAMAVAARIAQMANPERPIRLELHLLGNLDWQFHGQLKTRLQKRKLLSDIVIHSPVRD